MTKQQVDTLMNLIDEYAEVRHINGCWVYNSKTASARQAVIEALSGVQALSAAPAVPNGDELRRIARSARTSASDDASPTEYVLAGWKAAMLAALPTPPAEQQAAPKAAPGEQFDAEGFRAWVRKNLPDDTIIGDSAWWAAHLTTWAQRFVKAAPQQEAQEPVMIYHGRCTIDCGEHGHHDVEMLHMIPAGSKLYTAPQPAPQQEAQEPSHRETVDVVGVRSNGEHVNLEKIAMPPRMKAREIAIEQFGSFKDDDGSDAEMCFGALEYFLEWLIQQGWSKAPQPAPAPLSEMVNAYCAAWEASYLSANTGDEVVMRADDLVHITAGIEAALAAQGGK